MVTNSNPSKGRMSPKSTTWGRAKGSLMGDPCPSATSAISTTMARAPRGHFKRDCPNCKIEMEERDAQGGFMQLGNAEKREMPPGYIPDAQCRSGAMGVPGFTEGSEDFLFLVYCVRHIKGLGACVNAEREVIAMLLDKAQIEAQKPENIINEDVGGMIDWDIPKERLEPRANGTTMLTQQELDTLLWRLKIRDYARIPQVEIFYPQYQGQGVEHQSASRIASTTKNTEWKWDNITMDFITKLPRIRQKEASMIEKRKPMEFELGTDVMVNVYTWKESYGSVSGASGTRRYVSLQCVDTISLDKVAYQDWNFSRVKQSSHHFPVSIEECYADEPIVMPLEGIHVDDKLQFMEEPVEIMEREIKRLKRSRIPLVKVRWNSRRGPEFTWEREDSFKQKYPQLFTNRASSSTTRELPAKVNKARVTMSSATSDVTYTSVYTDSEPGRAFWGADYEEISEGGIPRVIVLGYDGLPLQPVAPPSPDFILGPENLQILPVPQDEDEREPMFIQAHDPDYVPEPIYPEYIPLEDDHEFPAEEQPLPPVDSPTAESPGYITESDPEEDPEEYEDDETEDGPVDYPMDGGDDGDDDDGDSSRDDARDEDEDEEDEEDEEEEEHLAPADSTTVIPADEPVFPPEGTEPVIPPPSTDITIGARITVRPQTSISLPPEAEVERLLTMTTPSPSPSISLSPPSAGERLARWNSDEDEVSKPRSFE
ncbi:hypothetical protein Tco_0573698 [Tanacetum coccineum]